MPTIPNSACNQDLIVQIEAGGNDWSFIYDIVKTTDIQISNTPHQHPIPYGHTETDHVNRQMDTLSITGVISCFRCNGTATNFDTVISKLKELSDRMMYCKDDYCLLTSNHWQFRFGILTNVNVTESQDNVAIKQVTTTWIGANLSGSINDPSPFIRGGIKY